MAELLYLRILEIKEKSLSKATPYAVWHVMELFSPLTSLMKSACNKVMERDVKDNTDARWIPFMSEFLTFVETDKAYI
jgi:hypothetical protein